MNKAALFSIIKEKKSFLCVGLDTDIKKIPDFLRKEKDPVFEFNRRIIDATADFCVAYKPNIAFYEAMGARGWESLQKTMAYIPAGIFTIADAKRGDIGNTSSLYASAFFDKASSGFDFDSVTVAPYMGEDSVKPFLEYKGKWVIVLALTSNSGSSDFQTVKTAEGDFFYEHVLEKCLKWGTDDQLMFVVGATQATSFAAIRKIAPSNFLLVPGVGAQGGSLEMVAKFGMNANCGLLVNASRSIIYAGNNENFARLAAAEAKNMQQQMQVLLEAYL